ncbi:hypothetical protein KC330_g117 [Hortaea werneckii]|nr:hypothetical protein KC330_g117 [Hortaea werneckii]
MLLPLGILQIILAEKNAQLPLQLFLFDNLNCYAIPAFTLENPRTSSHDKSPPLSSLPYSGGSKPRNKSNSSAGSSIGTSW